MFTIIYIYLPFFFRTAFVRRHVGDLYLGKKSDGFRATEVLRRGRGMDALGSRGGGWSDRPRHHGDLPEPEFRTFFWGREDWDFSSSDWQEKKYLYTTYVYCQVGDYMVLTVPPFRGSLETIHWGLGWKARLEEDLRGNIFHSWQRNTTKLWRLIIVNGVSWFP